MKTILVVDDNKLNLATARKVLEGEYRVIPVMRGEQALSFLQKGDCDMILLDINMPDMDGFAVLDQIRELPGCKSTPVIFLTADNDAETETRCFKRGAVDFIAKPFVPDVMLSRIGRVLELEDLRRNLASKLEETTREVSKIRNRSYQDPLTGLWNRAYIEETMASLLSSKTPGALMMIDIDNFKAINDCYGHIVGDQVLKEFAEILRNAFPSGDVLGRIGGDEFVVFVRGLTDKEALGNRATAVIARFDARIDELGYDDTRTSVSVGVALAPHDGEEFAELYNCADKALYYVKQNGKSDFHFYGDRLRDVSARGGKTVDLKYLQDLMSRADSGRGAYQLDFESFNRVYNFIRRFVERSARDVQTVLFTVNECAGEKVETAEIDGALELLEKAIYTSLRRSDVSTRYSSKQLIVILMDADSDNGDMVAERIIENFNKLYTDGRVRIDYGIARLDSRAIRNAPRAE